MPVVQATRKERLRPLDIPKVAAPASNIAGEIGRVTEAAVSFQEKAQEDANQIVLLGARKATSDLENQLLYHRDTGALNTKMGGAIGISVDALKDFDEGVNSIEGGLSSDRLKIAYRQAADSTRSSMMRALNRHEAGQTLAYDNEVVTSFIENEKIKAGRNYTDKGEIEITIAMQKGAISDFAKRNKKSAEWIKVEQEKIESDTHKEVIAQMLADGDDVGAAEYYNKAIEDKTIIDEGGRVKKSVDVANISGEGTRIADEIWDESGPRTDDDPVNIDQMVEDIESKTGDEKEAAVAKTVLKEQKSIHDAAVRERHDANSSTVWRALAEGGSYAQVINMPEYRRLDGKEQISVKKYVDSGGATKAPSDPQWARYWDYANNPDSIVSMSSDQIESLVPSIGRKLTNNLQQMKVAFGKVDLSSVKLTDKAFKEISIAAGIDPFNKDNKVRIAQIHETVLGILAEAQQEKGRLLTHEEKRDTMQREIDNQVIIDSGWWSKEKSVPLFTLSEEEMEEVDVPDKMRRDIEKALRARDIRVSDDVIRQYYVQYIRSK